MPLLERPIIKITDNLKASERVTLCVSEICGTAMLVFLGCLGCVKGVTPEKYIPHEQISLTFGLAVMLAVQCFGHISGCHINPIVTVAATVLGQFPLVEVPIYFIGQFIGAILGYALVLLVTPHDYITGPTGVCSPAVNPAISPLQGLIVEFTISLMLVLICCGVWDQRNSTKHDSVPIKFGLAVAVLAMAGGPYTGANMNPARSFAPALLNGDWNNHWVYWVGPLASAVIGAGFYRIMFMRPKPQVPRDMAEGTPLNEHKA